MLDNKGCPSNKLTGASGAAVLGKALMQNAALTTLFCYQTLKKNLKRPQ